MRRALMVLFTFTAAYGAAAVVNRLDGEAVMASMLDHIWILWSVVFAVAVVSVGVLVSHLYPKKEY